MELREAGVAQRTASILNKKNIYTTEDLMRLTPRKYKDYLTVYDMDPSLAGMRVAVKGRMTNIETEERKRYAYAQFINEENGSTYRVYWFGDLHMVKFYKAYVNQIVVACGMVKKDKNGYLVIGNPDIFDLLDEFKPKILPVYPKYSGISEGALKKIIYAQVKNAYEPCEKEVLAGTGLLGYKEALVSLHYPKNMDEVYAGEKRMRFNDLLYFSMQLKKDHVEEKGGIPFEQKEKLTEYVKGLPYKLTKDQMNTICRFRNIVLCGKRANMLIQGDVGCGKTAVAFSMMINAAENGYQALIMTPSQVLAQQHYNDLCDQTKDTGFNTVLLMNGTSAADKKDALAKIKSGEANFIVGTTSCLGASIAYNSLGLIVTDEEHKFGVKQKNALKEKGQEGVHVISMSATPMPRTLAEVVYGEDKDICTIKTMPEGRIPVQTTKQRFHDNTFKFLEKQVNEGRQVYVVCPAIEEDEDDENGIISVEKIEKLYRKEFEPKGITIGVVTGKMKKADTEATIEKFRKNEIQVLISTTVIEVGVNVTNATLMIVEQAERFGLASLHQLRGRVGRGTDKAYCILITDDVNNERINAMCNTSDGFEIAEMDLKMRGAGNLIGIEQSGANSYLSKVIASPAMYEMVKTIAETCLKNGYAKKLEAIYKEHERMIEAKAS